MAPPLLLYAYRPIIIGVTSSTYLDCTAGLWLFANVATAGRARQAYNHHLSVTRSERERESRAAGDRLATIIDMSFELMEPFGELRPENTAPFVRPCHRV